MCRGCLAAKKIVGITSANLCETPNSDQVPFFAVYIVNSHGYANVTSLKGSAIPGLTYIFLKLSYWKPSLGICIHWATSITRD